jgi:hypothetical protein
LTQIPEENLENKTMPSIENSLLTTPLKRELDVKPTILTFNNPP